MNTPKQGQSVIECENVSFKYQHSVVLNKFSYRFKKNKNTVLFGGNGAGKSTLLNLLALITEPITGTIQRHHKNNPAIVFQNNTQDSLLPITVEQCVSIGRWGAGKRKQTTRDEDKARIEEAITRLDIGHIRKKQLNEISGGQRQRALLAQMLVQDSELVLLDEPATGLDMEANRMIQEVIEHLIESGKTVIQATHDLDVAHAADEVLLLKHGRIIAAGAPEDVLIEENLFQLF